ncbi:NACHT domain-containing protein [Crocosphaera sp.]|uniref:NACHT domain-containing protein n=1 Tax=Crocosphaera sp. TaxID=2729996 RepID=UPI0026322C91|nr:NACHT domain-containing protein [Crocosphaera sp.]MDJ0581071.1 NACHT domain-containing protein [Crocosphaera sp.]
MLTGLEPIIIDTAAKSMTGVVIKTAWTQGSNFLSRFAKGLNENTRKLIYNAAQEYVKNYSNRNGILKVLGMREPVNLDDIYTMVRFLPKDEIINFADISSLEENYRSSNKRKYRSEKGDTKSGITVANEQQYLMVIGEPGAGKSTFLRKMGLEALKSRKGSYKHSCIPVFIELKKFTEEDINIKKMIIDEFDICKFPEAEESVEKLLDKGKLLILLDGLDEVPTKNLDRVINKIQDFVDKHDKNRFIISCRTAAYNNWFRRFTDVLMAEFNDQQIEQFINNWFKTELDRETNTAENCWNLLQKDEYKGAKELAQTPLLLTFLCLTYDKTQSFPNNRSVLYRKALNILLEEWASEKRIKRDPIYEGLHTELEEILLADIAYNNFQEDKLFFYEQDIIEQIKKFLSGNLNAPQHLNCKAVLNAIEVQQGILVERATDIYSFSHLTLQEYLTAQYILDHNLISKLVSNHITETRWKEVFILVAGLMRGGADQLLLLMENETRKFLQTPLGMEKLVPLLEWGERMTNGSAGEMKPLAKRAIAYAYANAYPYDNAYAKAYIKSYTKTYINAYENAYANAYFCAYADTYTDTIAEAINKFIKLANILKKDKIFNEINYSQLLSQLEVLKTQIPDDELSREVRINFLKNIDQIWNNAFHLTPELINLREEALEEIDDHYFYINWLMLQCKDAAVNVSPQTWEGIEDRMLRVI